MNLRDFVAFYIKLKQIINLNSDQYIEQLTSILSVLMRCLRPSSA